MPKENAEEVRARWSHLSDEEYTRMVREGEAHSAIGKYLQQKALPNVAPGDERVYEYSGTFPFPITATASELAAIALDSAGSWELDVEPKGVLLNDRAIEGIAQTRTETNGKLLARQLDAAIASGNDTELLADAANHIERLERFVSLIGLLAPAGTAPRTALEEIYKQSAEPGIEASQIVLDLRGMLAQHWGDWTPALREAESLSPIDENSVENDANSS